MSGSELQSKRSGSFQVKLMGAFVGLLLIPTVVLGGLAVLLLSYGFDLLAGQQVGVSLQASLEIIQMMREEAASHLLGVLRDIAEDGRRTAESEDADSKSPTIERRRHMHGLSWIRLMKVGSGYDIRTLLSEVAGKDTTAVREYQASDSTLVVERGGKLYGMAVSGGTAVVGARPVDSRWGTYADHVAGALRAYLRLDSMKADSRRIILYASGGMMALLLAFGALASVLIARWMARPIRALVEGTQELAGGNLDYRVTVQAKDELRILVDAFNRMASDLKMQREKLLQAERMAAWRDVARRIAHEIKNPLTPIELSVYRLERNMNRENQRYVEVFEKCASAIRGQVAVLRDMASTFSEFARMPEPTLEPLDVNGIVEEVLTLYGRGAEGVRVTGELARHLPQVMGDQDQLRRLLTNLVKNAIEAMPGGGTLRARTSVDGGGVVIEVRDEGVGMSPETQQRVFEPYFTMKEGGTGLGMAMVRHIVEAHGGEISILSEEGRGTQVRVWLPAME